VAIFAVDASTVLAVLFQEVHSSAARSFLTALSLGDELIAPTFILVECTSNLRQKVYLGNLTEQEAAEKLELALRMSIRLVQNQDQHRIALRMSAQRGTRRAYDQHYLAAAAQEGAEVVTIDGGMYQGAIQFQIPARLIR
jgi:predicted nucleic acid-binding protein